MRNLNAEVALNVEIARFMSASTDVPFFTGLDNAATAEIEKIQRAVCKCDTLFRRSNNRFRRFDDEGYNHFRQIHRSSLCQLDWVPQTLRVSRGRISRTKFPCRRRLAPKPRGDRTISHCFSRLQERRHVLPSHKTTVDNVRKSTDEIATPPNIFKLHFTERNAENFSLLDALF